MDRDILFAHLPDCSISQANEDAGVGCNAVLEFDPEDATLLLFPPD